MYRWVARMRFYLNIFQKIYSQLPYLRTEHQKTIQRQSLPLQSTWSRFARKWLEAWRRKLSKLFNHFFINSTNPDPSKYQGVCMDDIPSVEVIVGINISKYDIDLLDGAMVGELARRSIKENEKKVQLLRYNSHICYVDNIDALFKSFRCPTCGTYFQKTGNLARHLVRCSEPVKHIKPKECVLTPRNAFS